MAPAGVYRGTTSAEGNSRAPGCRAQGPLKGWNERGEYAVAFFSKQEKKRKEKHFQVPKLHYAAHVRPLKFRN